MTRRSESRKAGTATLTAYIESDEHTKLYVGIVPGVPGAHTEASSLDQLRTNLQEVLELSLEEHGEPQPPKLVGVQQIAAS